MGGGRFVGTKSEGGAFLRMGAGAAAGLTLPAGNLEGPGPRGAVPSSFGFFAFPGKSMASLIRFLAPVRGAEGATGGGGAPFGTVGAELADRRGSAAFDP